MGHGFAEHVGEAITVAIGGNFAGEEEGIRPHSVERGSTSVYGSWPSSSHPF